MNTEIICALISFFGVIFSSISSYVVAKRTSKAEMQKAQAEWKRDDLLQFRSEFADMVDAVTAWNHSIYEDERDAALAKTLIFRIKCSSAPVIMLLDQLSTAISASDREIAMNLLPKIAVTMARKETSD